MSIEKSANEEGFACEIRLHPSHHRKCPQPRELLRKTFGHCTQGQLRYVELHPDGAILAIASRKAVSYMHGADWPEGGNSTAILEFEVDDVDAERARVDSFVTDWLQQPKDMPWGNRSMLFRDPDGNPINFFRSLA